MIRVHTGVDLLPGDLVDDLHGFASGLLGEPSVGDALRLIAIHGLELAGAERAAVLILDGTSGTATVRVAAGADARDLLGVPVAFGESGTAAAVLSTGSPPPVDSTPLGPQRWLFIPLMLNGLMIALLAVGREREVEPFDESDVVELQAFAAEMGDALQLELVQEPNATDHEDSIAPNLRDSIIGHIHAAGLQLNAARMIAADSAVTDSIDDALGELDDAVNEVRTTIFPSNVADLPTARP
jgi:GAF domain-containing protein